MLKSALYKFSYPTANFSNHLDQIKDRINVWKSDSTEICTNFSILKTSCHYNFFNPQTSSDKGRELLEYLNFIIEHYIDPYLDYSNSPFPSN